MGQKRHMTDQIVSKLWRADVFFPGLKTGQGIGADIVPLAQNIWRDAYGHIGATEGT